MPYRKCVALFAAVLVGLGVVAVDRADAATVTDVTITAPADSGALRGIDSTFVVTVKVRDFSAIDSLGAIIYLVTADEGTVVEDNAGTAFSGLNAVSAISLAHDGVVTTSTAVGGNVDRWSGDLTGAGTGASIVNGSSGIVAVRTFKGVASTSFEGDADSVANSTSGDTTTFTWYGKVHYSSGTIGGVRAAAFAVDDPSDQQPSGADIDTSDIKVSAGSLRFDLDADRPNDPDEMVTVNGGAAFAQKSGAPAHRVTGFAAAADTAVLGIGDTLKVRVKLGAITDAVLGADSLSIVSDMFGKIRSVSKSARAQDTLNHTVILAAGDYGDLVGADDANDTDTFAVYIVDQAGNLSNSQDDTAPRGVTLGVGFFVDTKAPVLDGQVVNGDTILPVSADTITDGTLHTGFSNDLNPITYNLPEALDTLFVTFDANDSDMETTLKISNETKSLADFALLANTSRIIEFTSVGNEGDTDQASDSIFVATTDGATTQEFQGTAHVAGDSTIKTGLHSLKFKAQDLAGNVGAELVRTNVYVDVDDIALNRLFPTAAAGLDTLEEETAKVVFRLSEHADSVLITYDALSGTGSATRQRPLVGSELTNTTLEQSFTVDSLETNTLYTLNIIAADLAGNYTRTSIDTFVYDTTFVVPVIAKFKVEASKSGFGNIVTAGEKVTLTLTALTVDDRVAVTYKQDAVLKVTGAAGLTLEGTGLAEVAGSPGRATLTADDWIVGERTVTLIDTATIDTLSVTVQDCTDTNNLYIGALDSSIVVQPAAYTRIVVDAADTVGQGDNFWVDVTLADKFGNRRATDNRFVEVTASAIGVQHPVGAQSISAGMGGFYANSQGYAGWVTLTVRDIVDSTTAAAGDLGVNTTGNNFIFGTKRVYVSGDGSMVLDDPDTLIAQDYKGASGNGDQGGFVLLTFPASDDHSTLTGYRIYREITVDYDADSTGAIVELSEPTTAMVPWGRVDAVPGADVMRVVVATLDGDSTAYGVAAERGSLTTAKQAFDAADAVASSYELMAETMAQSKEAAQIDPSVPVFATLTPEALAFSERGVVPRMKLVDGMLLSNIRRSTSVRAIDDIAPAAITALQAMDTPLDAGQSITVQWSKSLDDRMLATTVPNAIGEQNTHFTAGVQGYNVYRKLGDNAWELVGVAGPGETRYDDATVFNGVRYNYSVAPFDADNVSTSEIEKSAMAIRNTVVDGSGNRILGLFGADNRVDYNDFFIFADHFGLRAGDEAFDTAFDLNPNNAVDFDDFFAFADNFGKELAGIGKAVPMLAGLNSDARFYLDAGSALPRVGEELSIAVSLEDYAEVRAYGLTVDFDNEVLEFVESRVVDNALGETELSAPRAIAQGDGQVHIAAFGESAAEGDLGLSLVFRATQEIESSYIELTNGALQDGSYGINTITSPVSVRVETRPEVYALGNNYPNPFNPETTIKYQLPEAGQVRLEVYNMLGQVVKTLVNDHQNAGRYVLQWDATNDSGQPLSSGVYFYRILAGGEFQSHKKMLLLK